MGRKKRYVITSAQAYANPHSQFMQNLEDYIKENDSNLIILSMIGKSANEEWDDINHKFMDYDVESKKRALNNNIKIEQFNIRPYQIDPLTGLSRFAQRETTLVFASPKQRLKPIAHSNRKMPKFLVTTGACTLPNYATSKDSSAERRRLGNIARRDHIYGALIVEIENDEIFHMRNLRADSKGKFIDLGYKYNNGDIAEAKLDALVLGDIHNGWTDSKVRKANYNIISELKPNKLVLHDFIDGHSVSHHVDKRFISEKILYQYDLGYHSLEEELDAGYKELINLTDVMGGREIYLVPSNHNEFLDRYLDEARYIKDPSNFRLALKLAHYMAEKDYNNPTEAGLKMMGKLPKNIRFLKRNDDLKVQGYQLGSHGDRGPRGRRGSSMQSKENDWGRSVTGHTHKAEILRDTYTVGTSTPLQMHYTRGSPTDWSNSHALVWENKTIQMIHVINGKWRLK